MKITDLHVERLYQLNEQGKGPFLRQTKHFEETSELAEAVYEEHGLEKVASEAIDGLLMLLSIAADYIPLVDFSEAFTDAVDFGKPEFDEGRNRIPELQHVSIGFATLNYIGSLQYITIAVQKHEGVSSAAYKGGTSILTIKQAIIESVEKLANILAHVHLMDGTVNFQDIYTTKMDKWERVSK